MQDPTYPLVPTASALGALLVVLTLAASGARSAFNRGVVMFQAWMLLGLLLTLETWRGMLACMRHIFQHINPARGQL